MTEIIGSCYDDTPVILSNFLEHVADFGFIVPQELQIKRDEILSSLSITPEQLSDAISDHLEQCGRYYDYSQDIQNSERRLEINQGLLLYAAELWYTIKNYPTCLATLRVLKDDIMHSRDMTHLVVVASITEEVMGEYAALVYKRDT